MLDLRSSDEHASDHGEDRHWVSAIADDEHGH
jgi:hypothetical protein